MADEFIGVGSLVTAGCCRLLSIRWMVVHCRALTPCNDRCRSQLRLGADILAVLIRVGFVLRCAILVFLTIIEVRVGVVGEAVTVSVFAVG